jgi:hypothetical protein
MIGSMQRFLLPSHSLKKSKWTPVEDGQLRKAVYLFGIDSWSKISTLVPSRTGKQCRERWIGQLAPSVSKDVWSRDEDAILVRMHKVTGNRWTTIACELPGRSSLSVKNRWNWLVRHNGIAPDAIRGASPVSLQIKSGSPPDILEDPKPCQTILAPLMIDDSLFGAAFQEFQAKMLTGFH